MSLQIIFRDEAAVAVLGDLGMNSDVFPLPDGTVGVAIPRKIVDSVGEEMVMGLLARVEYFDLYSGEWKAPNQALQHNDPSCHVPCVRTDRASRGRG